MCTGSSSSCPADVNNGFETSCGGLDFPLAGGDYSFVDYDVIVFGDFNGNTGDVERRVAVQGNFVAGNGFSVGYQIDETEWFAPYALVVGGNAEWDSGQLYPNGQNTPYVAPEEYIFVGGTFTGSQSLASLVTGSCNGNAGCLNSYFNAARQCYTGYQTALANNQDNAVASVIWSTLTVNCSNANANKYYITLTSSELSSSTYTQMNNCNNNAQWVVNIAGTDSVTFSGGSFFTGASQVVFNVLGSGRTINVGGYQFDGSLLAPNNVLSQTGGVIIGKVVVAQVTSTVQMNKYVCYDGSYQDPFYVSDK
jgi:choice-of-anchor A domain-containing protein